MSQTANFYALKEAFYKIFTDFQIQEKKHEGNTWCNAGTVAYNDNVHYELIQRNNFYFVEFHVETYANGRDELAKKLRDKFPTRLYSHFTYYSSYYWQTRTPVFTPEDVQRDVNEIIKIVESVIEKKESGNAATVDSHVPVGICSMKIDELLKKNLTIPPYQRGYCWKESNILDLLEDIQTWQSSHKKEEIYHIGTIILKKNDPQKDTPIDIIDGQQRLITLALWGAIKNNCSKENIPPLLSSKLSNNNDTLDVYQCLMLARDTIKNLSGVIDFNRIECSVVVLSVGQPDDLAYIFFSNTNSAGKRLSDYDLLKTHHLRYIGNENMAKIMAERWHRMEKANQQDELLHQTLFRLRNWRNNTQFNLNADETPDRDVFHHYAAEIESLADLSTPPLQIQFDSILSGGLEFFNYVEHYRKMLTGFNEQPIIKELTNTFQGHSNGILCAGMKALAFLFYCKFGDVYLKEAVFCIAYRISSLRNKTRIMGKYLSSEPVFSQSAVWLDRVTCESEFFVRMIDPKYPYCITNAGNTARNYWKALEFFLTNQIKSIALPEKESNRIVSTIKECK